MTNLGTILLASLIVLPALAQSAPLSAPLPATVLVPDGPPTALISQAQRQQLGLRNGPDSIVDLWQTAGQNWLVFSGAAMLPSGMAGGATFRLATTPDLRQVTGPLQPLLRAPCRDARPNGGTACTRFDSDYAGAGTILPCANGRVLYIYHGENHTTPPGKRLNKEGWTGIGQASWDPAQQKLLRDGQIAGLAISNAWSNGATGWATRQTPAASGNPSLVPDPTGTYFYLYYANRSDEPAATGPTDQCDRRTCWSVARAPQQAVCASAGTPHPAPWQVWHNGTFSTPALLPDGTGGPFTPLLARAGSVVDNLANVTFIPSQHRYVMAVLQQPGASIAARYSTDGLAWSAPVPLVGPAAADLLQSYPRIFTYGGPAPHFVLLYVVRGRDGWGDATLFRQELRMDQRK